MKTLRTSPSEIEQYRAYLADIIDLETLKKRLRKQDTFGRPPRIGTLWHGILETSTPQESKYFERDGITFIVDCDYTLNTPPIKELKGTKKYNLWDVDVTLVGIADGIEGRTGLDHKLTMRPDMNKLSESYQWRIYCVMFGLDKFKYIVYKARNYDKNTIFITSIEELPLYRYPEIESDVEYMVNLFTVFCLRHLPERIK
jgi:hypothetical protein